jgi:hypothetical protein
MELNLEPHGVQGESESDTDTDTDGDTHCNAGATGVMSGLQFVSRPGQ